MPIKRRELLLGSVAAFGCRLFANRIPVRTFTSLFDGATLDGWFKPDLSASNQLYTGGRWEVRDGCICAEQYPAGDSRGSVLLTERTFGDFELKIDVLPAWGCDSGVFLRANRQAQCLQVMVDYLPAGTVGFLHGQGLGGFFNCPVELRGGTAGTDIDVVQTYDAVARDGVSQAASAGTWKSAWRFDDWNTLRVRCVGRLPNITTWINDVKILEMESSSFHPRQLMETRRQNWAAPSAYDAETIFRILGDRGHIGLQIHPGNRWTKDGVVKFRNISILELA